MTKFQENAKVIKSVKLGRMTAIAASALFLFGCTNTMLEDVISDGSNNDKGMRLVWSDEFDGTSIDRTKWDFQIGTGSQYGLSGWGNEERQYYTEDNATLEDGCLVIEARRENKEGMKYTSSRLRTATDNGNLYTVKYGRVEARMKLPEGNAMWPAFWMLPATDKYGAWPNSGEIDIMEARGRLPNEFCGTLHYGTAWDNHKYSGKTYVFPNGEKFSDDFHTYAVEWEPGCIKWLIDGNVYNTITSWYNDTSYPAPFDEPFYILLNFAVGGNFDSEARDPDADFTSAKMLVDYVRVYQKERYNENVTAPDFDSIKDTDSFEKYSPDAAGNYVVNSDLSVITEASADPAKRDWFYMNQEGGASTSSIEDGLRRFNITSGGNQPWAVQFLQHVPVIKGYTYCVEFDAKADTERTIATKTGGDGDNGWIVYSDELKNIVNEDLQHYVYYFTMLEDTDPTGRIEFNMGLDTADVWLGNVTMKIVDKKGKNFTGKSNAIIPEQAVGVNIANDSSLDTVAGFVKFWDGVKLEGSPWTLGCYNEWVEVNTSKDSINGKEFRKFTSNYFGWEKHGTQLAQTLAIINGNKYRIEFDAKASSPKEIVVSVGEYGGSYTSYSGLQKPVLTSTVNHYSYDFTMNNDTDLKARLEFNLGDDTKAAAEWKGDIWLGNVTVTRIN